MSLFFCVALAYVEPAIPQKMLKADIRSGANHHACKQEKNEGRKGVQGLVIGIHWQGAVAPSEALEGALKKRKGL